VPIISADVSEEKLRLLLAEGHESEGLDFKETLDLASRHDEVELAKDLLAMHQEGGYVVIGADENGQPTGDFPSERCPDFDESRLRAKMRRYITEPFDLLSQCHLIDGNTLALIYIGPRSDGLAVAKADGQYPNPRRPGETLTAFRHGDVLVRHGTASERWQQHDVERFRRRIRDDVREDVLREMTPLIERIQRGTVALDLARGPIDALSWQLDEETFRGIVLEQIRAGDSLPLRLLLQRIVRDAAEYVDRDEADLENLSLILDRLACLGATLLLIDEDELFNGTVTALFRIYELGFRRLNADTTPRVWLMVLERVYALGAYATRSDAWRALALLATQGGAEPGSSDRNWFDYGSWLRHGLTMGARAGLFTELQNDRQVDLSLLQLALRKIDAHECLRPDVPAESADILDSLCRFDALASIAVIGRRGTSRGSFYPSFSRFYSERTVPALKRLTIDRDMRASIFPGNDADLALALRELDRVATQESFRFTGWWGLGPELDRWILEHLPDQ
jgi:hypothetical protein